MSEVKLTDEQRKIRNAEILRLHQENMPVKEIAERFSMSVHGVWFVLRNMKKAQAEEPEEIQEAAEIPDEPAAQEPAAVQPAQSGEDLSRTGRLLRELESQKALARAATNLMLAWKEKYESTMRSQKAAEQLTAMENAYFDALRAVAESTREVEKA